MPASPRPAFMRGPIDAGLLDAGLLDAGPMDIRVRATAAIRRPTHRPSPARLSHITGSSCSESPMLGPGVTGGQPVMAKQLATQ